MKDIQKVQIVPHTSLVTKIAAVLVALLTLSFFYSACFGAVSQMP